MDGSNMITLVPYQKSVGIKSRRESLYLPKTTPPFQATKHMNDTNVARWGHTRLSTRTGLLMIAMARLAADTSRSFG